MATVRDYMNPKLVYVREGDRPELALRSILDFGITVVPVLDVDEMPVGVVALRDIVDRGDSRARVTEPAPTIAVDAPVERAALALAEAGVHELVVVDEDGRAAGVISALDVIRALLGMPASHPRAIDAFAQRH